MLAIKYGNDYDFGMIANMNMSMNLSDNYMFAIKYGEDDDFELLLYRGN